MWCRAVIAIASMAIGIAGGCGRIAFDASGDGGVADGPARDGGPPGAGEDADAPDPPRIAYVGPFVGHSPMRGTTSDTFPAGAHVAGDAILIQVSCGSIVGAATAVAVTAPGWTFMQLGSITVSTASAIESSAVVAAIAPDASPTTVSVVWTGTCERGNNEIGDEFSMTAPGGGASTFDSWQTIPGTGNCSGSVTAAHDDGAVWAACLAENILSAVGPPLSKGADDGVGDLTAYQLTDLPSGTVKNVQFTNAGPSTAYILSMVTLKPR